MCEQEEECIKLLSEHAGIENTHLIKDNVRDINIVTKELEYFVSYAGVLPTAYIATSHAPIGDEFVTNYAATARVELLKNKQLNAWFMLFKGGFVTKRLRAFKWLIRYLLRGNRFETATSLSNLANRTLSSSVVKQAKRDKFGVDEKIRKDALYDAGCNSINEFSLTNRWSPDMTQRLEDCSLAAASYGIEYRWPLLDIRLIELFLSIPSEYKLRHGLPRYLHRRSIQGLVPEHLIWKDKDMGAPLNSPKFESIQKDGLIDLVSVDIEKMPKAIRAVINQNKWQTILAQLKELESGSIIFSSENQHIMMLIQPIIELVDWLKIDK